MQRANSDSQPSTQINNIQKDDLDYSEELKLNIQCDDDNSHMAVLFCLVCKTNLCKVCADLVHSRKSVSGHQIVRLSEKPEPSIKCPIHPLKKAKLMCKEPSCDGQEKPMCTMCHQYETHKGHKYEMLDNVYDQIRENVENCSKEIERKRAICEKIVEEYDNCISTYSNTDAGFMKTQRDEIYKFFAEARSSALKTFDDFAKYRVEKLNILKNQYINEKLRLDIMSLDVRKIGKMRKLDMIENGGAVNELKRQAERKIDEPTDFVPFDSYIVTYPNADAINIQIELPELQNQSKILAVWTFDVIVSFDNLSENLLKVENKDVGRLFEFKNALHEYVYYERRRHPLWHA